MRTVIFSAFCGWEFGKICLDRSEEEDGKKTNVFSDLTLEEAKKLVSDLQLAISQFEDLDRMAKDYFEQEAQKEKENVDES